MEIKFSFNVTGSFTIPDPDSPTPTPGPSEPPVDPTPFPETPFPETPPPDETPPPETPTEVLMEDGKTSALLENGITPIETETEEHEP